MANTLTPLTKLFNNEPLPQRNAKLALIPQTATVEISDGRGGLKSITIDQTNEIKYDYVISSDGKSVMDETMVQVTLDGRTTTQLPIHQLAILTRD